MGLKVRVLLRARTYALLPTKNSLWYIQSFGRFHIFFKVPSQVAFTFCIVFLSRLIFVAVILSSVSLLFMLLSHLALISSSLWCFCCMTRSHLNTHMRCAASVIRICSSLTAPLSDHLPLSSFQFGRGAIVAMPPQPSMIPMDISGHRGFSWGQSSSTRF